MSMSAKSANPATVYPGAEQAAAETLAFWLHDKEVDASDHHLIDGKLYPRYFELFSPTYTDLPNLDYSAESLGKPEWGEPEHFEALAAFQAAFAQDGLEVQFVHIHYGYPTSRYTL